MLGKKLHNGIIAKKKKSTKAVSQVLMLSSGLKTIFPYLQNPLLGGGDLSTIIERKPQGNSETDGYSKYHNRGGVSYVISESCVCVIIVK